MNGVQSVKFNICTRGFFRDVKGVVGCVVDGIKLNNIAIISHLASEIGS